MMAWENKLIDMKRFRITYIIALYDDVLYGSTMTHYDERTECQGAQMKKHCPSEAW